MAVRLDGTVVLACPGVIGLGCPGVDVRGVRDLTAATCHHPPHCRHSGRGPDPPGSTA